MLLTQLASSLSHPVSYACLMNEKKCSKCDQLKPQSEFFRRSRITGKLHSECKECYGLARQSYQVDHYRRCRSRYLANAKKRREKKNAEYRALLTTYLSDKSCNECGESDIRVLELDHFDPANKEFTVSQGVKLGYNMSLIRQEMEKCQVLCSNCHRKRTAAQFNWYKNRGA